MGRHRLAAPLSAALLPQLWLTAVLLQARNGTSCKGPACSWYQPISLEAATLKHLMECHPNSFTATRHLSDLLPSSMIVFQLCRSTTQRLGRSHTGCPAQPMLEKIHRTLLQLAKGNQAL
jgi:hypothetical protein